MKNQPALPLKPGTAVYTDKALLNPPTDRELGIRLPGAIGVVVGTVQGTDGANYRVSCNDKEGIYGFWEIDPVTFTALHDKLEEGEYDFPSTVKSKRQMKMWEEAHKSFASDLFHSLGLNGVPKAEALLALLWDDIIGSGPVTTKALKELVDRMSRYSSLLKLLFRWSLAWTHFIGWAWPG